MGPALAEPGAPDGAAVFEARCARCHGGSGRSDTTDARALKVRPLVDDREVARMTPAEIVKEITSNAKHHGVGAVTDIDEQELAAVAGFVKELAKKR
jgi:mono/diheme cytochrome c family protein